MIYLFLCLWPLKAVEIKEQLGLIHESSETRGFFETLGQAASLVSRGQLLRRQDHWQPCSELSLAACCQREALRVNDGAGRCRCAQAHAQAELCALEWQSCDLPKEACCQSLPARMLVAFGNSSASGYAASCACAPGRFGPLSQLQLEQRCEGSNSGQACTFPSFVDLDDLRHTDLTRHGPTGNCLKNASAHFTVKLQIGRPYLLRFQVRHSENKLPVELMIGPQRTSLASTTTGWLERSFRASSSGLVQMRIRAPCASLGEVQFATCKEDASGARLADMLALASNHGKHKNKNADALSDAGAAPAAAPAPAEPDQKDVTIDELKDRVKEDEDKITELEYEKNHAEMQKKDAEAAAAEPGGGSVPTWLAVVAVGLVFITGPLLKMKASQKAAAAAPKAKPKAAPKGAAKATAKALPKAGAKALPKAGAKSKAVAKAKAKSAGKLKVPEVSFKQLKAILRLQARVRGWKARLDVHPTGPKEKSRTLNDGEQIAVSIQNISVKNVPEVNLMGGVDPFLEVQCGFSKDPDAKGRTSASKDKVDRTEVLSGDANPKFSKTLDLPRVYNKPDQFMNFLLFDSGTAEDTFIASKSLSVNKLLEGIRVFDLQNPPKPIPQELVFMSEVSTKKDIKAKFDVVICEAMKFVFNIKSGEKFPEVDSFGGIDSFIEIRATRSDVTSDWFHDEDPKCIWSGRTQVHTDSVAPKFEQEIKATLPADPTLKIQIILWDSNAPMADFPVAHHIMDISEEICHKQDLPPVEHIIKFQKIPGQAATSGYQKASLKFSLQTSLAEQGVPPPAPKAAAKTAAKAKAGPKAASKAASKASAKPKGAPGKGAVPAA